MAQFLSVNIDSKRGRTNKGFVYSNFNILLTYLRNLRDVIWTQTPDF